MRDLTAPCRVALVAISFARAISLTAQTPAVTLTYVPGSSVRLEQIIGDCDYQAQARQIVNGQPVTCGVPTAGPDSVSIFSATAGVIPLKTTAR